MPVTVETATVLDSDCGTLRGVALSHGSSRIIITVFYAEKNVGRSKNLYVKNCIFQV